MPGGIVKWQYRASSTFVLTLSCPGKPLDGDPVKILCATPPSSHLKSSVTRAVNTVAPLLALAEDFSDRGVNARVRSSRSSQEKYFDSGTIAHRGEPIQQLHPRSPVLGVTPDLCLGPSDLSPTCIRHPHVNSRAGIGAGDDWCRRATRPHMKGNAFAVLTSPPSAEEIQNRSCTADNCPLLCQYSHSDTWVNGATNLLPTSSSASPNIGVADPNPTLWISETLVNTTSIDLVPRGAALSVFVNKYPYRIEDRDCQARAPSPPTTVKALDTLTSPPSAEEAWIRDHTINDCALLHQRSHYGTRVTGTANLLPPKLSAFTNLRVVDFDPTLSVSEVPLNATAGAATFHFQSSVEAPRVNSN
ncbi:hypothetical protein JAAARDRAFT_199858 [Jaapia argillacea MUCL 33604]|uniref:Uncharacterized protein n=1 Tax=Jaapia argillacea MUCL 33604 TaxID=933084 RepID=A0A067P761_9AGAM|nr:hypothetical protein JAAARDRAFT_199858 [Jaapia argillacea MUCL 33604]